MRGLFAAGTAISGGHNEVEQDMWRLGMRGQAIQLVKGLLLVNGKQGKRLAGKTSDTCTDANPGRRAAAVYTTLWTSTFARLPCCVRTHQHGTGQCGSGQQCATH